MPHGLEFEYEFWVINLGLPIELQIGDDFLRHSRAEVAFAHGSAGYSGSKCNESAAVAGCVCKGVEGDGAMYDVLHRVYKGQVCS